MVGAINQSKYVPMMSLAVVGTLTNQILWIYVGLCGGLYGSMRRSMRVCVGLGNIIQSKYVPMMSLAVVGTLTNQILWVYVGLRGSTRGSMQVYADLHGGLCRAGEHYPIKICANDVIGCGGDINQSDFVGLCGSMQVYTRVYAGLCRSTRGSMQGWGTLSNQNLCQ